MIPPSALVQTHLGRQTHLLHPLKAAVAIEGRTYFLKFLNETSLTVVIFESLKVMRASANARALIDDDAVGCSSQQLLAGMTFLLARIIVFALLFVFRLAFGLLDAIDDEGQFRVRFTEFFDGANALLAAFAFGFRETEQTFASAFGSR